MARRDYVPTTEPLVRVVEEQDEDNPLVKRMVGYVTGPWRRFNESVATAIAPGAVGEAYTSNGVSAVWAKIANANVSDTAAIVRSKLSFAAGDLAWTIVSKTGSSLADLATRSAGDLTSGTLAAARLPALSSSFLVSNTAGTVAAGATAYLGLPSESATEAEIVLVMPLAGVLRRLFVNSSAAAGAGETFTYTVRKNAGDTALTCTISGAAQTANSDVSNSVSVAAGDLIAVKVVNSAGGAATRHQVAVEVATA